MTDSMSSLGCHLVLVFALLGAVHTQAQESSRLAIQSRDAMVALRLQATTDATEVAGGFEGFKLLRFEMDGVECRLACPRRAGVGKPWIWRARFWGHQPQLDAALLERGWHVAYCDVSTMFGCDAAVERWNDFYEVTQQIGLHPKPVLEGMSRGGLIVMRWASANPDRVSGIYLDNAVLDMRSWPGGKGAGTGSAKDWRQCLAAYGITSDQSIDFADGPLDRLKALADHRVPLLALINLGDDVVPPKENGDRLEQIYQDLGGPIQTIRREGLGHHPHSLKDPTKLVDFATGSISPVIDLNESVIDSKD